MSTPCFSTFVDVKFNGKNYKEWSVTVRMILLGLGLIKHIDGTPMPQVGATTSDPSAILDKWREADHQAMAVISQSVEIDFRLIIASLPTAQEIWNHLSEQFNENPVQSSHSSSMSPSMDPRLFDALRSRDVALLRQLHAEDSSTPHGNTILHLAVIFRQDEFAKDLCVMFPSLLSVANAHGNTPLLLAAALGIQPIVVDFVNAMAVARRSPPRFNAMMMESPASSIGHHQLVHWGQVFQCSMSWAVERQMPSPKANPVGHSVLVEMLLKQRPGLGGAADKNGGTPLHYASRCNKLAVVKLLLKFDASLAYVVDKDGYPPITGAVIRGYVCIVKEIVRRCPDFALMTSNNGYTLLHSAVYNGEVEVVKYILRTPELQGLINQPNYEGEVPLHIAVRECNKKTIRALLACKSLDKEAVNHQGQTAVDVLFSHPDLTVRQVSTLEMLRSAFPNHHRLARGRLTSEKKLQIPMGDGTKESLFRKYANNSIVVATLMATITFAAAFTVPGGYDSNQDANQGHPILARKAAFKAFLISDTIALCASLAVAFLCIFAPWVDDDFLVRNVDNTRRLLFCGFAAMSVAFATGLYAVVEPGSLWLAAVICVLCCSLPPVTYLAGEWTVYGGRLKLLMSSNLKKIK